MVASSSISKDFKTKRAVGCCVVWSFESMQKKHGIL